MSRYHHYSPYAGHRSTSRWPWLAVLIVAAALAGAVGLLVQTDHLHLRDIRGAWSGWSPANDPGGGQGDQEAALAPGRPTANEPAADRAATAPPAPTATATPAPTVVAPADVAAAYVERWTAGDYDALYDLLSSQAQAAIARQDFVERYQAIADRAQLTRVTASVDGRPDGQHQVPIRVEFASAIVGEFAEENRLPLVQEGNAWRVAWTPSLIFKDLGSDGCVDVDVDQPRRGSILDRDGQPLAYDGTVERVGIVPGLLPAADETRVLSELSKLTAIPPDELKQRYEGKNPDWFIPIKDFPEERGDELLNVISQLPGVSVQPAIARIYPLGAKAAHITGYIAEATAEEIAADPSLHPGQVIGQAGIEAGADDLLTGTPGGRLLVVQCQTRAERSTIAERAAVPAKDVVLTIDRDLQVATDDALSSQGDVKGSAVVLDPRTGAVLAMVSHPSYDPNGFVLGFSDKERQAIYDETRRPLLNRAAQASYPTGSIFKVITFSAAMEDLGDTAGTVIDCPSTFSLDGASQVWQDWTVEEGLGPQGPLTLHQALVNSCNTVFYQLGRDLDQKDSELLPNMAKAFGLGAPTEIPYLPEAGGTVPDPQWKLETVGDYWATGDAVNLAIGQGFLAATPLQMATAYAAIADNGDLLRPYIVAAVTDPSGQRQEVGKRVVRSKLPISATTLAELQSALRDQTSDWNGAGSARVFGDFAWPIAGKTGTAQNELDKSQKPHSWFAAYGPYGQEATIASIVMIENVGEGVSYAAPVTRRIYEAYLSGDLANQG